MSYNNIFFFSSHKLNPLSKKIIDKLLYFADLVLPVLIAWPILPFSIFFHFHMLKNQIYISVIVTPKPSPSSMFKNSTISLSTTSVSDVLESLSRIEYHRQICITYRDSTGVWSLTGEGGATSYDWIHPDQLDCMQFQNQFRNLLFCSLNGIFNWTLAVATILDPSL